MLIRINKETGESEFLLAHGQGPRRGTLPELKNAIGHEPLTLVMPAEDCLLREAGFKKHERKLLHKIIPWSLEEELIDRVDDLHFALGQVNETGAAASVSGKDQTPFTVPVCVTDKSRLADIVKIFSDNQVEIARCVPEYYLLPWQPGRWTVRAQTSLPHADAEDIRCLLRYGRHRGLVCNLSALTLTLELLMREASLPDDIHVIAGADSGPAEKILAGLPETVRQRAHIRHADNREHIDDAAIDLLQGAFAPKLPWDRWWVQWRIAAVLVIAIGCMEIAGSLVEIKLLESESAAAMAEIESVYRRVIPDGVIVDAELQLLRRVEAMQGNAGSGFIALLDRAAPVIMDNPALEVSNLTYNEAGHEIHLTLVTADFDTVETVRSRLQALGLEAELLGSTADSEGSRSRLRIKS